MKFNVTRRDVLRVAGGTAAGVMLSPAPWKLLDDVAIWTQNWSWIPVPPKGEATLKTTACSLCPAGCGLEARLIAGAPVALRGAANDPVTSGAACPLALTGHHLAYHPARITNAIRVTRRPQGLFTTSLTNDAAAAETGRAIAGARSRGESVAILDLRPGRSAAWAWRRFAGELPKGVVIAAPGRAASSFSTLEAMTGAAYGVDYDGVRTVVAFGAPVAYGWGSPRLFQRIASGETRLIDVEPLRSRTADIAQRWIPARPGTEAALALGIANVLIAEGLASPARARDAKEYEALVATYTPARVAAITGLDAKTIVAIARDLAKNGPAVVIAGEDAGGRFGRSTETAILGLNALLGAFDSGALVPRAPLPDPLDETPVAPVVELTDVPDRSIGVLLIDASAGDAVFPWSTVSRKLVARGATVIAISPFFAGTAAHADIVVPSAPFLEATGEAAGSPDAPVASLAFSVPILTARGGALDPAAFARLAAVAAGVSLPETWATSEELMKARVAKIHAAQRGLVTSFADGGATTVAGFASPDELWDALVAGARWSDDRAAAAPREIALLNDVAPALAKLIDNQPPAGLTVMPRASRDVTASAVVSPVMTKLYQETTLRPAAATAAINPETARELELKAGSKVKIETAEGRVDATIATDESIMPSVVALSVAPDARALGASRSFEARSIVDVCTVDGEGSWRSCTARVVEA